jgi:predicted phage baseplate assembly protein
MIPPRGVNNIKCKEYQYGGGTKGNVVAGTINELRTSIPYIDGVTNIEAAEGGADAETLDKVKERGPQTLKHRDRAVTWEDYEWLVRESSTLIARVKCIPAFDGATAGQVTMIVIPESAERTPYPNSALLRQVNEYLQQRGPSQICTPEGANIKLAGPEYIEISVVAIKFKATDMNQTLLVQKRISDNLNQFLHPLRGGPEGKGWDFGRSVYPSEIYSIIESTEGVDHVSLIELQAKNLTTDELISNGGNVIPIEEYQLVCSGTHEFIYN